ncbi:MAG: tripartite tricarboxylate transporter substrate binding protein [Betaproteobacteria bacterium]|jgi:tripartite-type tricarboxylate transporter receptor subunit TctC|nr:tripartite tricarboxylate transporter substrate binding protein [Betaproteobacteria bacterium]
MTLQNRTVLLISLFIIQIFGLNVANAQYPDRPIRIIVPFAPGGGVDALARPFAKELSEILKQNVIVENKPSASGQIGNTEVARAKPDGYTLLFTSAAYAIAPAFNPKLPYDTLKDLDPISILASNPLVLVASNNFKGNSVSDMVKMAKANSQINFAQPGNAGIHYLASVMMASTAGVKFNNIAYKGAGAAFPDLISGQVDVMFDNPGSSLTFVKGGKLRLLATTGLKRSPISPDTPTVSETLPGFNASNWFVLAAPANTPVTILDKLQASSSQAMRTESMKKLMERDGIQAIANSRAEANSFVRGELSKWSSVIKENNLQAD